MTYLKLCYRPLGGLMLVGFLISSLLPSLPMPVHAQAASLQKIESDDARVIREGLWEAQSARDASAGSYLYNTGEAILALNFAGPSLEVIYVSGPSLGTLAIEVDGTVLRTVITTAENTGYGQVAKIDYLTDEAHELKVYAQGGGTIAIDAFIVALSSDLVSETAGEVETSEVAVSPRAACVAGYLQWVSVGTGGTSGPNASEYASVSGDGRYTAFTSLNALVAGDTNATTDIFIHDRQTCTTIRASVATGGGQANFQSLHPAISRDGRYVAFESMATNLAAPDTDTDLDIYWHDTQTGTTSLVSIGVGGVGASGESNSAGISGDGRYVIFRSGAPNFIAGDTNVTGDIFMRDIQTGTTTRVSVGTGGTESNSFSFEPAITGDGRYITFTSSATNLVAGDTNGDLDIFVHDTQTNTTTRVSVATGGSEATDGNSRAPAISDDGRYVVFYSFASTLVTGDTNICPGYSFLFGSCPDTFLHDRQTTTTTRINQTYTGGQTDGSALDPSISADGRFIVFVSESNLIVRHDTNRSALPARDAFLYDRQLAQFHLISHSSAGQIEDLGVSEAAKISADGRYIVFVSHDNTFSETETDGSDRDVYLADRLQQIQLRADPISNAQVTLTWQDYVIGEAEFIIERSDEVNDTWVEVGRAPANATTFTSISLRCGLEYVFRVRADYGGGQVSGASMIADATPFPCTTCILFNGPDVASRTGGTYGNGAALHSAITPQIFDGGLSLVRYAAFESAASNLVPSDTNGVTDIFVRYREYCELWRVSVTSDGTQSNGNSARPVISTDARYIAFESTATNLVTGDTNGVSDIFVHDHFLGITTRISIATGGGQANGASVHPTMSSDARYIIFESTATNLTALPDSGATPTNVYVHDRQTGTTTLVTVNAAGTARVGGMVSEISSNGQFVVFMSQDNTLVASDTNADADVFVRNLAAGTTERVNLSSAGAQSNGTTPLNGNETGAAISEDGRYVAFYSNATNLVTGDSATATDIFVRDRQTNTTRWASHTSNGVAGNGNSSNLDLSGKGRYVVFESAATNLVANDTNGVTDIFRHDVWSGATIRLSVMANGTQVDGASSFPVIERDGQYTLFVSSATNLGPSDTNTCGSFTTPGTCPDIIWTNNPPGDKLALFDPALNQAALLDTIQPSPAAEDYINRTLAAPRSGQWLMGDWDGDGVETPGVYGNGAFSYTNQDGTAGSTWTGIWIGLVGRPAVEGQLDPNIGHDCIGVIDSFNFPPFGTGFAMYWTCNLTSGPTPTLAFQWLSVLLPDSAGFTGTHQFFVGRWSSFDSVAVRRGQYMSFCSVPPTTVNGTFPLAHFWGTPPVTGGAEGQFLGGNFDAFGGDEVGILYPNNNFYWRDGSTWNPGTVYNLQQVAPTLGTPLTATSWR